jgi:thioredoxin 1
MLDVTNNNFEEVVLKSDKPVILDFWAPWCGQCKMMLPALTKLEEDIKNDATIVKVNVDEAPELATKYGVSKLPTFVFVKNGEKFNEHVGVTTPAVLKSKLN